MKVSIIVATHGDEKWAELARDRAIPSALRNANSDVVIRHDPRHTLAQVRNAAAAEATGDWLCFVDADDQLGDGYIDAMEQAFILGAITTDWSPLLVPAALVISPSVGSDRPMIPNRGRWPAVNECIIGTLVRVSCFQEVGGFRDHTDDGTELTLYEDYDLFLRCYDAGAQLVYVENAVYRVYPNPQGGRNAGPNSQAVYDAIWRDHLSRLEAAA